MTIRRFFAMLCAMVALSSVASAIEAPADLTIFASGTDVTLRWQAVAGATEYNVYKEVLPIDDINVLFPYATTAALTYADNSNAGLQYHYVVTAVVPSGDLSGTINDTTGLGCEGALVFVTQQGDPRPVAPGDDLERAADRGAAARCGHRAGAGPARGRSRGRSGPRGRPRARAGFPRRKPSPGWGTAHPNAAPGQYRHA